LLACLLLVTASPRAQALYGIAKFGDLEGLVIVDMETGASAPVSDERFEVDATGADFGCDGQLNGFSRQAGIPTLYTIDLTTGEIVVIRAFPDMVATVGNVGFEYSADGVPFALVGNELYRLDIASGTSTFIGSTGYDGHANLALGSDGLFRTIGTLADVSTYLSLDPDTAETTALGPDGIQDATSIIELPSGRLLSHKSRDLHELDPDTGELLATIGALGRRVHGLGWGPVPPVDPAPAPVGNVLRVSRVDDDLWFEWADVSDVGGFDLLEFDGADGDPAPEELDAARVLVRTAPGETAWVDPGGALRAPARAYHQVRALSPCPLSLRPGPTCDGFPAQVACP